MFRPNCRAIFRVIFEQVECTFHMFRDILYYILADIQHNGDASLEYYLSACLSVSLSTHPSEPIQYVPLLPTRAGKLIQLPKRRVNVQIQCCYKCLTPLREV